MDNTTIILSDLDGTLFHDDKSISDFTKKTIADLQAKGFLFGISTSRAKINAVKFLNGISPDILITNGGGMVSYKGTKVYSCGFSVSEIRALIKACFDVFGEDVTISVDNETGLYSNSKEELGDKFWTYNDFSDFGEPCMKLCIKTLDKEKVAQVASCIGIENVDFLPFSDIPWFKLSKKGATKEKAIESLCAHLNVAPQTIAAFGDDFNDIGMLKIVGRGVAMKNAIPEVKAATAEVCDSNENDGVANWIQDNLLR